ncbi:hypothetical protein MMPV_005637 [Pyropia vietnamensis]
MRTADASNAAAPANALAGVVVGVGAVGTGALAGTQPVTVYAAAVEATVVLATLGSRGSVLQEEWENRDWTEVGAPLPALPRRLPIWLSYDGAECWTASVLPATWSVAKGTVDGGGGGGLAGADGCPWSRQRPVGRWIGLSWRRLGSRRRDSCVGGQRGIWRRLAVRRLMTRSVVTTVAVAVRGVGGRVGVPPTPVYATGV